MNDQVKGTLIGDPVEAPVKPAAKPPSRQERIAAWRKENEAEYRAACDRNCMCTPSRADMLLMDHWNSPPVD